jgi:hypothetical protein
MKKFFIPLTIVLAIVLMALPMIKVGAWALPTVTPLCAPDSSHFSFNVYLASESDYNMEWYWDSTGSYPLSLQAGNNIVTVPRGSHSNGDSWYIRWSSDPSVVGTAKANGTLCHKSHTVTWDTHPDCIGWIATYSIDGGSKVVYDSGSWTLPYVLETAKPKAFTVPEISGDIYDYPNSPNVTIYETKDCQKTHTVTWNHTVDCNGWSATYSIDGATAVVYDSGSWTLPYVLESAIPKTFTIPENSGELYDNPNAPKYVINEPGTCQQTHKVTYGTDNSCTGGWDAWYSIDGGNHVNYANGSWTEPLVLETANVPAENIPTVSGQTYDNPHKDGFAINEPADCLATHKVTWSVNNDCTGWSATYAIDGGSPVSYASGTWSEPYVLESANVPAENIPTVSGQTYDNPHKDGFTVNEPENCLITLSHNHSLAPASDCTGWSVTPSSNDGGVFTPSGTLSGTWKDQYNPESATVNGTWNWTDGYSVSDSITINKDASCIVNLKHNAVITVEKDCTGWSASFGSSDGGVGTATTPTSGVWTDPYSLEHATVSYHVVWSDGYSTDISNTVNEPDTCLHTKTSVTIIPGPCKYQKGQDFSLVLGDGLTFKVFKTGDDPATATPVVLMTNSGPFHLPKDSYFWIAKAGQGYDIVGPDRGNITVNDNCNAPPPPPPTQKIGLAMLTCTDGSMCYDQGADGVCWIKYSLAAGQMFDTANAVKWCDLGPGKSYDPNIMKVYVDPTTNRSFMDEVFLAYPYTKQCWGPDNKGNCVLDQLLGIFNQAHGSRYQYGWLFPGFGGH